MGFHAAFGTPLVRLPKLNGQDVDLLALYETVTELGGWERVSDTNQWTNVNERLHLPVGCVNSSVALKQVYLRYLDKYEKTHFVHKGFRGEPEDDMDFNVTRMNKQSARSLFNTPTTYNDEQHYLTEEQRSLLGLNALGERGKIEKLCMSLMSPLPNEQDFAINVCCLLSLQYQENPVDLRNHPKLLVNLLAHAGVFADSYLRDYFIELYEKDRGHEMKLFWINSIKHDALSWLTNENNFRIGMSKDDDCIMADVPDRSYLTEHLTNYDFFISRICQIARVILNFTEHYDNAAFLASDVTAVRFVLLCCDCKNERICEFGWDILCSIAWRICLRTVGFKEVTLLVCEAVTSENISLVVASLRVLSQLALVESNSNILLESVDREIFFKLCTYLTLQDVFVILCTLETLYSLSQSEKVFCDRIFHTAGMISLLVLLLRFRIPVSATFGTWKTVRITERVVSEDGTRTLSEKEHGQLSVRPPVEIVPPMPYHQQYYVPPAPDVSQGTSLQNVSNESIQLRPPPPPVQRVHDLQSTSQQQKCCTPSPMETCYLPPQPQKDETASASKDHQTMMSPVPQQRRNSLLASGLKNMVSPQNGVKPTTVTVSTVGPAITLKAHLEEPVTKIVKITNPSSRTLIESMKSMNKSSLKADGDLMKNTSYVTKSVTLNGKEYYVATPLSPPPSKSEESSNSSNSDDSQDKVVTNNSNHCGGVGSSEENSNSSISNSDTAASQKDLSLSVSKDFSGHILPKENEKNKSKAECNKVVDEAVPTTPPVPAVMVNGVSEEIKVNGLPEPTTTPTPPGDYLCEWRSCLRKFTSPQSVFTHITTSHCPQTMLDGQCRWGACTAGKMVYKFLIRHIIAVHCDPAKMQPTRTRPPEPRSRTGLVERRMLLRQQQMAARSSVLRPSLMPHPSRPSLPSTSFAHSPCPMPVGLPMATPPMAGEQIPGGHHFPLQPPGPAQHQPPVHYPYPVAPRYYSGPPPLANTPAGEKIAESIRLTSALVLRNVARMCPSSRLAILQHEQQIVEIAASEMDASKAAAECLYYLRVV
ncbi:Brahma associated protein 170kD [Nesidiocoris tenuis]|nr:Brahma associated protein 170kD [Nesidiocoris tenuis]